MGRVFIHFSVSAHVRWASQVYIEAMLWCTHSLPQTLRCKCHSNTNQVSEPYLYPNYSDRHCFPKMLTFIIFEYNTVSLFLTIVAFVHAWHELVPALKTPRAPLGALQPKIVICANMQVHHVCQTWDNLSNPSQGHAVNLAGEASHCRNSLIMLLNLQVCDEFGIS